MFQATFVHQQLRQLCVTHSKHWRAQHLHQSPIIIGTQQPFEQRHQIQGFKRIHQPTTARALVGNLRLAQQPFITAQMRAPVNQYHDVGILRGPIALLLLIPHRILPDQGMNRLHQLRAFIVMTRQFNPLGRLIEPITLHLIFMRLHNCIFIIRMLICFNQSQTSNVSHPIHLRGAVRDEII